MNAISAATVLPHDVEQALLVGRVWRKLATPTGELEGPCVVLVRKGEVLDITASAPTTADLFERENLVAFARSVSGESLGSVHKLVEATLRPGSTDEPRLLAPSDVQAIKACGVTF